ncbi:sigma-70 family RNA polymerase sigma factor [Paenibacillus polymyxa]|uniref:sigma-70 family RNA polymerase sigma factor n=1 Tax=Paenibacillus polymyxa TaxID=1406 RepID=UPI0025B6CBC2|nr:sigma-70 family RNA polymerase sigma factor [Paenibacillus polymyxa]MDN4085936.1 sigma-70 family RNA polymerase sigma factor [Paenibacillus polymyxa]MDN4111838.1 sigma-70 family RNA polymerase sigma factor [Paenibacillus polymyxa]
MDETNVIRMVMENQRLVHKAAQKYLEVCRTKRIDYEDMVSEGNIGLLLAARRFDASRGYAFSTFATRYIHGHMLIYINDKSELIRVPRNQKTRGNMEQKFKYVSFNRKIYRDDKDRDSGKTMGNILSRGDDDKTGLYVKEFLDMLTPKQRVIVEGLMQGKTQQTMAKITGMSRQNMSDNVIKKIRNKMKLYQQLSSE